MPSETIRGRIDRITYKNAENGYTVFTLSVDGDEVVAVGNFPFITVGDTVTLTGGYTVHATYGPQFRATECVREMPSTAASVLRYLSSGAVKGIGPATARKIVSRFGTESLDVIKDSPDRLCEIRGISPEKAKIISEEYQKQFSIQDIMFFLSQYKISPEEISAVYKRFGNSSVEVIKENPFLLCDECIGISFPRADEIAENLGFSDSDENRIFAGIEYILRHNLHNGHTCLPRSKVLSTAAAFLECEGDTIDGAVEKMILCKRLVCSKTEKAEFLFLPAYYAADEYIALKLSLLMRYSRSLPLDDLEIDRLESVLHIKYDDVQRRFMSLAFANGVTVLTGGPGTGKTTALNGLIELFSEKDQRVLLAAPTGRAAKRMSELCGREAKTVHRLLEVQWGEGDRPTFSRNEKNPLPCDVLIVDEMSMVDSLLFESLLRALRLGTRLVLVGDSDQLPSVSAGNVLHDIISSERLPFICLQKIFRQADASLIVHNAHKIINGCPPVLDSRDADFFMLECKSATAAVKTVTELCAERLPKAYGFSPTEDIQVLCPSRKLELGTVSLNTALQESINPVSGERISYNGFTFHQGDKVMQTKNNYDLIWHRDDGEQGAGVYNGDIGKIETVDPYSKLITVRFDERVASYYDADISQLEPAYAITVHKSQGSEFDCVILPLFSLQSQLAYRNLLYTAVTRAKRMLIIVGNRNTVIKMVENDKRLLRYSGLESMIREVFDE